MDIHPINPEKTLLISGDIDDWDLVRQHGVDTIIDLDGTIDSDVPEVANEILYIYFPFIDDALPDERKLTGLGQLVAHLVQAGQVVLIHCFMGLNRSNLLAATALTNLGMEGPRVMEHLQSIQPAALYNEAYAEYVQKLPARNISLD